jgi:hypothetical protein
MRLPSARDTLESIFREMTVVDGAPELSVKMLRVFVEFFAWSSREEIGANVVLDKLNDRDLAEKIARFLWDHRHDGESSE